MKDRLRWIVQFVLFLFQVILSLFIVIGNEIINFLLNLIGKK